MTGLLAGQVAVITGAASGIGRATALAFAAVYLASDLAAYVSGASLTVDGAAAAMG